MERNWAFILSWELPKTSKTDTPPHSGPHSKGSLTLLAQSCLSMSVVLPWNSPWWPLMVSFGNARNRETMDAACPWASNIVDTTCCACWHVSAHPGGIQAGGPSSAALHSAQEASCAGLPTTLALQLEFRARIAEAAQSTWQRA